MKKIFGKRGVAVASLFLILAAVITGGIFKARTTHSETLLPTKQDMMEKIGRLKNVSTSANDYVPGEVLVKFKSDVSLKTKAGRQKISKFFVEKNIRKKSDIVRDNVSVFQIADGKNVEDKIAELKSDPNVLLVQPNYRHFKAVAHTPTDADFSKQ
ncbi:MAG: hypothetical protein COX30_03475 [Candidatus Moranbacteria bacterium CG23_combo_of_CG06-09_8_20_14_all_39_10]|nr:MAG: hypothetical protein COX30_03475 [Candidatus Moranbacteria bacterium CG23_combo_of_CG06-09_8_20_14_all_39_10]